MDAYDGPSHRYDKLLNAYDETLDTYDEPLNASDEPSFEYDGASSACDEPSKGREVVDYSSNVPLTLNHPSLLSSSSLTVVSADAVRRESLGCPS